MRNNGNGRHTYTSLSKAWSLAVVEKCCSRIDTVPVSATWPQPQNNATPEKQSMVATSEAYGTPPRHLMQHSKQPKQKRESKRNVISKKQIMRKRTSVLRLVKATGTKRPRHWHAKQKIYRWCKTTSASKAVTYRSVGVDSMPRKCAECSYLYRIKRSMRHPMKWKKKKKSLVYSDPLQRSCLHRAHHFSALLMAGAPATLAPFRKPEKQILMTI